MSRRSIRKRRHRYWPSFAAMMNRADAEFVAQAAVYERWFAETGKALLESYEKMAFPDEPHLNGLDLASVGVDVSSEESDCTTFVELWRETYSSGPDEKSRGTMTVVSVNRDAGTFTSD